MLQLNNEQWEMHPSKARMLAIHILRQSLEQLYLRLVSIFIVSPSLGASKLTSLPNPQQDIWQHDLV